MRDALSRRSGGGAPEPPPPPPGPPPTPDPPIPTRPTAPDAPGGDSSRPSPRPSRPTPSKPPPNNLHGSAGLPRTPGTAGQESHGATGDTMPKDSPAMGRVGLLGRSEMGTCPDLLQRRSGPGSAARRNAEYQRYLLARFGATRVFATDSDNRRHQGPRRGAAAAWAAAVTSAPAIPGAATPARPSTPDAPGAQTCTSHSKVQFQPLFSSAKCTSRRGVRPADALDREPGARSGPFRSRGASTPGSPWGRGGRAAAPRRSPRH